MLHINLLRPVRIHNVAIASGRWKRPYVATYSTPDISRCQDCCNHPEEPTCTRRASSFRCEQSLQDHCFVVLLIFGAID